MSPFRLKPYVPWHALAIHGRPEVQNGQEMREGKALAGLKMKTLDLVHGRQSRQSCSYSFLSDRVDTN
jgi:hypothetical protein